MQNGGTRIDRTEEKDTMVKAVVNLIGHTAI